MYKRFNNQPVTGGSKHLVQRCVEGMLYGALPKCSEVPVFLLFVVLQ